ncbi:hypothetical protein FA15DRAFT_687725 [Coprinopsis marcescibilis]|uniref:Nucleoporin protein Ndc1-Nup n=1 Tax=Coprinopsis marcescibilis TaxID=230819 RepID=A0A5C3KTY2_COPMA|nr:hypothetical protein FA15DRAFT_687725 [Coprinopsis marcescibilis]
MSTMTPKTPIRAIKSTLVNRSSPSVGPASQTYEPLVKSVLAYRLSRVFSDSAAICFALQALWTIWQKGGPAELGAYGMMIAPFKPVAFLGASLLWATAAVPVIVIRKTFLTAQRTPATSPKASLAVALAKPSTKPAFLTYLISAIALAIFHSVLAYKLETEVKGDPRLTLFVKSRKHPHYLNGRLIFILLSQVTVASSYLFRNMLRDRFAFRWVSGRSPLPVQIVLSAIVSIVSITSALPLACLAFGVLRMVILPVLYRLPFVHAFLKPFVAHFLRGPYTFALPFQHISVLGRAWFIGFTTFFLWETAESFFDGLLSEPVTVASSQSDKAPNVLISGISSTDVVMKYYAFAELSGIAQDRSATAVSQRQAIFGDHINVPNLWGTFVRETLLLIGEDYQLLLRRGAPAPGPSPTAPPPPAAKKLIDGVEERLHATPAPLFRTSVLRNSVALSPKEEVLDNLGSDGPLAHVVDKSAEAAHLPDLFKSVSAAAHKNILKADPAAAPSQPSAGFLERAQTSVRNYLKASFDQHAPALLKDEVTRVVDWWTEDRVSRVVDATLPMRELDVVVIEVLTRLVCASLTEDRYGVVQRDIPKILEALLSYLTALEEYQVEILTKYSPPPLPQPQLNEDGELEAPVLSPKEREARQALLAEVDKATDLIAHVSDGLKDGVVRIARTFGDKLSAFKFPPRTAQKLQGFVDFCQ